MILCHFAEHSKAHRKQSVPVLRHEIHDVIIVPQKQRTFCNLEMRRIDAHRDSPEQGKHSLDKLCCLCEFQHFLQFPRNRTSFWLFVTGQYFSNPRSTVSASRGSFSTN